MTSRPPVESVGETDPTSPWCAQPRPQIAARRRRCSPSPSRGVAKKAQLNAEAGGQGRHHAAVSDVGHIRVDGTQSPKVASRQRWAPEQNMARCVRLLLADPASGSRTLGVVAPLTSRRRSTADPVKVLLRAAPVADPKLMHVFDLAHDGAEPSVRPAPRPCGSSVSRYGLLDGPGVDEGLVLREGAAGFLGEVVRTLIAR